FDQLAVLPDAQLGEVGVIAQFVDVDVLQLGAEAVHDAGDQVVRERPRRMQFLDAPVNAGGLKDADHDRENAFAVDLLEPDHLVIDDLANNDALQLHLHRHRGLAFGLTESGWGPDDALSLRTWWQAL